LTDRGDERTELEGKGGQFGKCAALVKPAACRLSCTHLRIDLVPAADGFYVWNSSKIHRDGDLAASIRQTVFYQAD
jgi:hypothetical protein